MKKIILLFIAVTFVFSGLDAQKKPVSDIEAINFLNRTNKIMRITKTKVVENKVYTGGLAAAKDYQQKAIVFFKNGNNRKAVNQSYIARRLSFRAFVANTNQPIPKIWKLTQHERKLVTVNITHQKIEAILIKEYIEKEKKEEFNIDDVEDIN